MDELEAKVIDTIQKLNIQNAMPRRKDWGDILATAALATVGALAFWYAMQTTKPKDVLENVRTLEAEVAELKHELLTGTRPADVLVQLTVLQRTIIEIQTELQDVNKRLQQTIANRQAK